MEQPFCAKAQSTSIPRRSRKHNPNQSTSPYTTPSPKALTESTPTLLQTLHPEPLHKSNPVLNQPDTTTFPKPQNTKRPLTRVVLHGSLQLNIPRARKPRLQTGSHPACFGAATPEWGHRCAGCLLRVLRLRRRGGMLKGGPWWAYILAHTS